MLLDHGRLLAPPPADRATFGVDLPKQIMGTHHAELAAAHVHAARTLEEWASLKEHVVQTFAKTPMSRMWGDTSIEIPSYLALLLTPHVPRWGKEEPQSMGSSILA